MAPVLFLYVMQAIADTIEKKWYTEWGLKPLEFKYMNRGERSQGRLFGQPANTKGTNFDLFYLLFVDDGVFLFDTQEEMVKGGNHLYELFKSFGLQMHIGKSGEKSKTQVMYFAAELKDDNHPQIDSEFELEEGFIRLVKEFVYLGSLLDKTLKDDRDILLRVQKATVQVKALKTFFRCPYIPLNIKYKIFLAIPVNTALWGCESWALNEDNKRYLRTFQHKSLRTILNINMYQVKDYNISNELVREWFCNIPDIIHIIMKRQMKWIGHVAKMPYERLPRKLLAAWSSNPRKSGRPQNTFKNSYFECVKALIPNISDHAPLTDWIGTAASPSWPVLITSWWKSVTTLVRPVSNIL